LEDERAAKADRANAILKDETFTDAISRLENEFLRMSIEASTVDAREEARKFVILVRKLPDQFGAIVLDGHVAQQRIDEWRK